MLPRSWVALGIPTSAAVADGDVQEAVVAELDRAAVVIRLFRRGLKDELDRRWVCDQRIRRHRVLHHRRRAVAGRAVVNEEGA